MFHVMKQQARQNIPIFRGQFSRRASRVKKFVRGWGCAGEGKGCLAGVRRPPDGPEGPVRGCAPSRPLWTPPFTPLRSLFDKHLVWHDMLPLHELPRRAVASLRSAHRVLGDLVPLRISKRHSCVFVEKQFLWCAAEDVWVARGGDCFAPLFEATLRYSTGRNVLQSFSSSNIRLYAPAVSSP